MQKIAFGFIFFLLINNSFAENYFQQEVGYHIKVLLDDQNHALIGEITIDYYNNSNDTLNQIYFHLWPNAYKNIETAFAQQQINQGYTNFFYSKASEKGYIDSLFFKVDGQPTQLIIEKENIDIAQLQFNNPLHPSQRIKITTTFYVKIPYKYSRLGHIGNDYYITQWFPKPAVYDNTGWHPIPYLDMGEFYSEYGIFNVDIFVPKDYIVAATGSRKTASLLEGDVDPFLRKHKRTHYKKLSYSEEHIHDFAWFASKKYTVQKKFIQLAGSQKKVEIAAYHTGGINPKHEDVLNYIEDALNFYSKKCIEYPYNSCKVVIGETDGGMEYPTITVVGNAINKIEFEAIVVHEIGHNWFYNILGSNERDNPWIDEGFNSYYELLYFEEKYGYKRYKEYFNDIGSIISGIHELSFFDFYKIHYQSLAIENAEQPLNLKSNDFDLDNYYYGIYFKTALGIYNLKQQLGNDEFDSIMQSLFEKWKYKHPQTHHIRKHFEQNTEKDISWFFDDFLTTKSKNDYKIKSVKSNSIKIKKKGSLPSPLYLKYWTNNSFYDTVIFNKGNEFSIHLHDKKPTKILLDPHNNTLDINQKNNNYNSEKVFSKADPLKLKFLGVYEKPGTYQINYVPFAAWNNYDKFMPGFIFYNGLVPSHKFEYFIFPSYSIRNNLLNGTSYFQIHFTPSNNFLSQIKINLSGSMYSIDHNITQYKRFQISPEFYLSRTQNLTSFIKLNYYYLNIPYDIVSGVDEMKHIMQLSYTWENKNAIISHKVNPILEAGKGFSKIQIESNHTWKYSNRSRLKVRFFAGTFITDPDSSVNFNFRISGSHGLQDYTYNNIFLGRSEIPSPGKYGLLERQFIRNDGGFTTFSYLGQSKDWIIASNTSYKPPFILPIQLYFNIGMVKKQNIPNYEDNLFWESGIDIFIIPDIFDIYFPIFMSSNLKRQSDFITDNYWEKVRFTFKMNINDPYTFIKSQF